MSYSPTEVPFYLQGSQTGGILQGMQQPSSGSYIPSISGTQPQQYTPGYGQAPYADPSTAFNPSSDQLASMVASGQAVSREDAMRQLLSQHQQGTMSSYSTPGTSSGGAGTAAAPGSDGLTVVGQQSAADQARNASIMNSTAPSKPSAGGGGGGGSAGGAGSGTTSAGGLGLSSLGPTPTSAPALDNSGFPINPTNGYAPPGSSGVPGQDGTLQMQQADPQASMNQYQNTLGYQMLGNDQTNQYQQSPGYQYAVNEALRQVGQNASARGLLDSGNALRAMTDRAQGMAQQDYGNWWNRQNQLYGDYQNRLQGLAGGSTGSQDAMNLGQTLGAGTLQTGSNMGSLFGNQGTAGMGGIINTAAAQSQNMTNAGIQQAKVDSANQSTRLAGATLSNGLF